MDGFLPAPLPRQRHQIWHSVLLTVVPALLCVVVLVYESLAKDWQEDFHLAQRTLTPTGVAPYSILVPGFQLVLASTAATLTITVLEETKAIHGVLTRVVEEREERHGAVYEMARNFVALDPATGDMFSFGETVDVYQHGHVVSHAGSWQAYTQGARPALLLPGAPHVGLTYYQELAPGVAMARAEIVSLADRVHTPAGTWTPCVTLVAYTTPRWLDLLAPSEYRAYAPGIGVIQANNMKLVRYGYRQ